MSRYWRFCEPHVANVMSMDVLHAAMIRNFLVNIESPANVIEVGCCHGVSTAAILQACEVTGFSCSLIDTFFQDSVKEMVREAAGRVSVVMDAGHSVAVLGDYCNRNSIVLLDGDHRRAYTELESEILERQPPRALILHDVTSNRADCDGPAWALHRWQAMGYFVAIDYLPREGQRTERGLAILCRDFSDAEVATGVMCGES